MDTKKSRNPLAEWWRRAGTRPPRILESSEPYPDTPEYVVGWLNKAKGARRRRMEEFVSKLRITETTFNALPLDFGGEIATVAVYIMEICDWGALDRLRVCKNCNTKWFFAAHANYQFCSDGCREAFHQRTEVAKRQAKIRMQKYRQRLKEKEQAEQKMARKG